MKEETKFTSQFTAELPSTPELIKWSPNEESMQRNATTLRFKRRIFPFPVDQVSHSEQQHLSRAGRDQGHCSGPANTRLVNTFSNEPEIDWEVGTDKQLYSEEKEVKSQAVWLSLYHQADAAATRSICESRQHICRTAQSRAEIQRSEPRRQKYEDVPVFLLSTPLSSVFVHFGEWVTWRESVLASKWCHRKTYSTETQLFLLDFSISWAYQHHFRAQHTTEQSNLLQDCISLK